MPDEHALAARPSGKAQWILGRGRLRFRRPVRGLSCLELQRRTRIVPVSRIARRYPRIVPGASSKDRMAWPGVGETVSRSATRIATRIHLAGSNHSGEASGASLA